jgi:LysM repeat protein
MFWVILLLTLASFACNFPGGGLVAEPVPTEVEPEFIFTRPTPVPSPTPDPQLPTPTPELVNPPVLTNTSPPVLYYTQAGDTLKNIAVRFDVLPEEITSPDEIPADNLINPGQLLVIPWRLGETTPPIRIFPDSEVVYSPSAADFDVNGFVQNAGGRLSKYTEFLGKSGLVSGAEIVRRVALDNSINPLLLLALIEHQSGWVYGEPGNLAQDNYPLGRIDVNRQGLYKQLVDVVNQLSIGYYGWREGRLTTLTFADGSSRRMHPELNAGTAALQYLFAGMYSQETWEGYISEDSGLVATYVSMFGDPWVRAQMVEPLYPPDLAQPDLILPFMRNQVWAFTGGPHGAWEHDGAWAALDFAPGSSEPGCTVSYSWITASGSGLVARSERGVVVVDMDGDGYEQTGWAMIYLHVAETGRVPAGTLLEQGDKIGYPSCEGGIATGTHVHIARKYNGEWIPADGPMPFVLGGWQAHNGAREYLGSLTRGDETITASDLGTFATRIIRTDLDP